MTSSILIPGYSDPTLVGKGADGVVYKAIRNGRFYCIKVISRGIEEKEQRFKAIKAVTQQHDSLCSILDAFRHGDKFYVVMRYYPKNLATLIYGVSQRRSLSKGKPLEKHCARKILWQLVEGIHFLHSKKLAHRDLKPENILLDDENNVVICDFDRLASFKAISDNPFQSAMTPPYHPPEMFTIDKSYGPAADYFALGVIFYEMLVGEMPYKPSGTNRDITKDEGQKIADDADRGLVLMLMARNSHFRIEGFNIVLFRLRQKFCHIKPLNSSGVDKLLSALAVNTSRDKGQISSSSFKPSMNSNCGKLTSQDLLQPPTFAIIGA
ncbi:hypothetical protein P9112_010606 [Eukaryota sp. TZLM1-RC]